MCLKIIHIDRKKIDLDAEVKEFWETVLKPKWEKQARARGEKLMAELIRNGKPLTQEFTVQSEIIKPGEKLKLLIEVDGDRLNIKRITKNEVKKK